MKQIQILILLLLILPELRGQYYYQDVLLTNRTMRQAAQYKELGIKLVRIRTTGGNNPMDEQFSVEQQFNNDYTRSTMNSRSAISGPSEMITLYDKEGRLVSTVDSSDGFKSQTSYRFNRDKRIQTIHNISFSPGGINDEELHEWIYGEDGAPEKMLKIKNGRDTTTVSFVLDEEGRIGEEHAVRNQRKLPVVYYYYDDGDRLTDIVRFNEKARRLLPDLIFEYDDQNRMKSMMVVPEGSSEYQLWVYSYDERGLKIREQCFDKDRRILGNITYTYNR